ncbi:helix-turn-helix domain-containing protein [Geminisphaera colitermitum]|uniref:helix-turn-helix domain-containing protein n=1 Tax=Geminisphaera colitermitum TaxID=1148786 RepID=UPI000158CF6F|nr:helix-turn-helix transcriptional regulator [Geminisphaera colitermitum]
MPVELPDAFGQVLRDYRTRKGWSQMKLAMEAGMHLNALGNLERGLHNPSLQTIFLLCQALEVSMTKFMASVEARIRR